VYLNTELSWSAKLIFLEIDSFTEQGKDCYVSNEHLAKFAGIAERNVRRALAKLEEIGWIEKTRFDGRKRYMRSTMCIQAGGTKASTKTGRKRPPSPDENVHILNTVTNPIKEEKTGTSPAPAKKVTTRMKTAFMEAYQNQTGTEFYWAAKESTHCKQLAAKIVHRTGETDDQKTLEAFKYILNHLPKWYRENLTITLINSKFNELIAEIKQGNPPSETDHKRDIAARLQ